VRFESWETGVTHALRICNNYCFSRQQWLRERTTVLRYSYSASSVPRYVRLLCTQCVLCTVYRLWLCAAVCWYCHPLAVTAVRFEMRYHVHWWLSVSHVHHQVAHTRACENVFCGNIVYYFSEKVGKCLV